jgi:hypothetical protein
MRLIDADQMAVDEYEAYMSAQVQITDDLKWLVNFAAHSKIQRLIADTPTVDAVLVVRCKDCIYTRKLYGRLVCKYGTCSGCILREDFFCANGERKEGAEC